MSKLRSETSLKSVLKIAIPIALQQLLTASLHLVDTGFIVRLGNTSTAAIGAAGRLFFAFHVTMFGLCSGMMIITSQFWGIKDIKTIRNAFGMGLINLIAIGLIVGISCFVFPSQLIGIFTNDVNVVVEGAKYLKIAGLSYIPLAIAVTYALLLRSTENVKAPLFVSFVSVGTNTILNYLLIFGKFGFPRLGIQGAAIATLISALLQCALYILICKAQDNVANATIAELIPRSKEFVKKFYKTSVPTLANELLWVSGVSVYSIIYGRQGTINFSAYTIFSAFDQIMFTFFIGLCSACAVIIGKLVGRHELNKAYDFAKKYIIYTEMFAIFVSIMIMIFAPFLIGLMNPNDAQTYDMAVKLMRLYSLVFPLFILPYISIIGIFRPAGSPKIGMILDGITVWFVGVPATLLAAFVFKLPFEYIYIMFGTEHLVKSILCILIYRKRKWLRPLTA